MEKIKAFFEKIKKNFEVIKSRNMEVQSFFIIYIDDKGDLIDRFSAETRCSSLDAPPALTFVVPRIGETIINGNTDVEYEVKDVIRTIKDDEYGVYVRLKEKEKRQYNF